MNVALLTADFPYSSSLRESTIGDCFPDLINDCDNVYSVFVATESNILKTAPKADVCLKSNACLGIDIYDVLSQERESSLDAVVEDGMVCDEVVECEFFSHLEEVSRFNPEVLDNESLQDNNLKHDKVINQFKEHLSDYIFKDGEKISLHLHPEELGKITIEMDFGRKMMSIETTSSEVGSILRSDLDSLKESLVESGLEGMSFAFKDQHDEHNNGAWHHTYSDIDFEDDKKSHSMEIKSSMYLLDIFV